MIYSNYLTLNSLIFNELFFCHVLRITHNVLVYGKLRVCMRGFSAGK